MATMLQQPERPNARSDRGDRSENERGPSRTLAWPLARPLSWMLALGAAISVGVYLLSASYFLEENRKFAVGRASLYTSMLDGSLERLQHLPFILARDHVVMAAAADPARREALNLRLERFAERSNVDAIYLMDPSGLTVAASNHAAAKTFLGENYSFRPYFREALAGRSGVFYGVGATTRRPGYFMAAPVQSAEGALSGVIAVKVSLGGLQSAWRAGGETVLVSNRDGVVLLSSNPDWLYRTISAIEPARRVELERQRQFGAETLAAMDWRRLGPDRRAVEGTDFIAVEKALPQMGWTLHYLAELAPVRGRAILAGVIAAVALSLALLAALALRSERLRAALATSQAQRRALQKTNRALQTARHDLAQATRMAALGELSAAVTHELGQPISAMRNYLVAAEIGDTAESRAEAISRLSAVVGRMENATRQLKHFASPAGAAQERLDLQSVLEGARLMMAHDLEEAGVVLEMRTPPAMVRVLGDRLRLEQAVVNLMRNAVAAMENSEQRRLTAVLREEDDAARIEIGDTGHGLGSRTLEELQQPFHSTRPSGEGMGLGLAIAAAIVREHSGRLNARNGVAGGAVFSIVLPRRDAEIKA